MVSPLAEVIRLLSTPLAILNRRALLSESPGDCAQRIHPSLPIQDVTLLADPTDYAHKSASLNLGPLGISIGMGSPFRFQVDDHAVVRRGLTLWFQKNDQIQVVGELENAVELVRVVKELRPDVVVMDLQMPVMDGVEATRQIKEQWPAIKVIVLTVQAARRAEAFSAGADHFLLKGNGPEALQQAILS